MTFDEIMRSIPPSKLEFIALEKEIIIYEVVMADGHVYAIGDGHAFEWIVMEAETRDYL